MTCPAVTSGSVTAQTGSVNGWTSAFVDAYGDRQGADFNWQYPVVLSDKAGVGARWQQNKVVKGEHWLMLALVGARTDGQPVPFPTPDGTARPVGVLWDDGAGSSYKWTVTFVAKSTKNCNAAEKSATGGTVTFTRVDATVVEAAYDVSFGGTDTLQGSVVAPRAATSASMDYTGCPTRPSTQTCIAG